MFDIHWYDYDNCKNIKELVAVARATSKTEYVWLCHRAVDYTDFNFRWLPPRHQTNFYHAWPSHDNPNCYTTWLLKKDADWADTDTVFHGEMLPIQYSVRGDTWHWITDPHIDYSNFNFNWFPDVWDWEMSHEFTMSGTERLSYTKLTNGSNAVKYHWANLTYSGKYYETCLIDTGMNNPHPHDFKIRLITTMDEAIKTAVKRCTTPWLWIVSDCCDYTDFDFSYIPEAEQINDIHCWPSGSCENGDTFLIYIPAYLNDAYKWNFDHPSVPRLPWPVVYYNKDSLAQSMYKKSSAIYTLFTPQDFGEYVVPDICIWHKRPVVSLSQDNSVSLIPRDCMVKDEIYEYPYLQKSVETMPSSYSDVIFISNGEPMAETNWEHLVNIFPDAKRVNGVVGRDLAYKAAAKMSNTPWFYAVFAKTWVNDDCTFNYTPDYWQEPKHYIFHSRNPLNGLEYGSMNINLYNAKLVLQTETGLDFTLSSKHTVIPICLSETRFNDDPYVTWRSAFREIIKLRQEVELHNRVEVAYRYHIWKTHAVGENAEWCLRGANDGDQYYSDVGGDPEKLQYSFDWRWLEDYFKSKY